MSTFRSRKVGRSWKVGTAVELDILPPEPGRHSVGASNVRTMRPCAEVIDAEFIAVPGSSEAVRQSRSQGQGRSGYRSHNDNSRTDTRTRESGSISARALARAEGLLMRLSADSFAAVAALIFMTVFTLSGGLSLFLEGAQAETPLDIQAAEPLDITHATITPQDANGMKVLLINGIVENRSETALAMPAIRADLVSGEKLITSTLISPPATAIAAGHSRGFSARVPHAGGKLPELRLSLSRRGA